MNPLTQVKNLQKINARELEAGIGENASWHAEFKNSTYFVGGLDYELSEGDVLAAFAQFGEVVDLIRDRSTGKSKGIAFLAFEDQRSTVLAVDNLNGATLSGRIIRVNHAKYRRKTEEDVEEWQKKREENGVCYEFQRGNCNRGDSCKFSHDQERNRNTGWGANDESKWKDDHAEGDRDVPRKRDRDETRRSSRRDEAERDTRKTSSRRDDVRVESSRRNRER